VIVAPAVDLKGGRCVQLVGGRPEQERVSVPDPVAQSLRWADLGFGTLHLVDLDAALALGDNRLLIRRIVRSTSAMVQVGGGIRDKESLREILDAGAARVIVGTRAVDEPAWLEEVAEEHPETILVAADVQDGRVLRKGWTESTGLEVSELLRRIDPLPLAGVLCTDVGREGRMEGTDLESAGKIVDETRHPVWISGGITTLKELRALEGRGAAGAVLGMALYTGTLSPEKVAKEFGA